MPSSCVCYSLLQSLLIILIISLKKLSSTNDNQHQILKADVGQTVTMSCLFDQEKIEQVSFMRQMTGDILSLGSELFVQESSSNHRIQLKQFSNDRLDFKFLSVNQNDSGIYTCMLNDDKLSSFLLEIFVPPRFLSYFPIEGSISYSENSSMNLSCHAFGIPSANITWIYRDQNKQSKTIHDGEDVYIPSLRSSDSGYYECIASNSYHASISRSFYVTVQYVPRVMILNDQLTSDVHDTVIIKCHICSIPEPIQIYWLRDQQILIDINIIIKIQKLDQHQCTEAILEIVDISEYQFGRYQCRAENNLGEKSAFIDVQRNLKNMKLEEKEFYSTEINRNGRTALLIDQHEKFNSTSIPKWLTNNSSKTKSSYFILLVILYQIR